MNRWSLSAGVLVVSLCLLTFIYPPRAGFPGLKELSNNPAFFEGKDVRLEEWKVLSVGKGGFWYGSQENKVFIKWSEGGIKPGDYVTVKGVSHLASQGFVEAQLVHVHDSFLPLYGSSFIGMLILFHIFNRHWRIELMKLRVVER